MWLLSKNIFKLSGQCQSHCGYNVCDDDDDDQNYSTQNSLFSTGSFVLDLSCPKPYPIEISFFPHRQGELRL